MARDLERIRILSHNIKNVCLQNQLYEALYMLGLLDENKEHSVHISDITQ
jgi:hypothetical protein